MHHRSTVPTPAAVLGHGGLIPFVAGAILVWAPAVDATLVARVFLAYAATIFAFLGGLQWGIALLAAGDRFGERLIVGVLPSLAAWVALLLPASAGILLLAAGFAALLAWERARAADALPRWYGALRMRLSVIVVACHVAVALARV